MDRKEVNLQVITLTIYQLDLYYQKEVIEGITGQGDFVLSDKYKHLQREAETVNYPRAHIALESLPFVFTNKDVLIRNDESIHTSSKIFVG